MYRPPKDLDGIPGAKDLIMCLTGYLRQDRDDIMVGICYTLPCDLFGGGCALCFVSLLEFTFTLLSLRPWSA